MVKIETSDSIIWHVETVIPLIVQEWLSTGSVDIDLNNEGPSAESLGLYSLLDNIADQFGIDKSKITLHTRNIIENHSEYNIKVSVPYLYQKTQQYMKQWSLPNKDISKHFGIFIGRSNWARLLLSGVVFKNFGNQSVQTFHYDSSNDFHKTNLGLEQLLHIKGSSALNEVSGLIRNSPIKYETLRYPILIPENLSITNLYKDFFVEIVCETYFSGTTFFPTEKTWRPIACLTPFMIQGPRGFLKHLRMLGFKTFSDYWDESYDEDGPVIGTETIARNLTVLSKLSPTEINDMYKSMLPTLIHNKQILQSMNDQSWKVFND